MILPSTYAITLALIIFGMLCWGSWASLFQAAGGATGKMRFELFYFDFAIGTGIASLICALTFGTLGFDGFNFMDDLLHASKKQDLVAILAGGVFNLAEGGMSLAFPLGLGTAIVIASVWQFILKPGQNLALMLVGDSAIIFGLFVCTAAYRFYKLSKVDELVRTGQQKSTRRIVSARAAWVAVIGGVILGSYLPLISNAMEGEAGVGPYSLCVLFAAGIVVSTFFFNLFFMNLPLAGAPLEIFDYFKASGKQHLFGLIAGALWILGLAASLVAAATEGKAVVAPAISYGLLQGSLLIAALWGLLVWKEFADADGKVRSMLAIMLVLFVCGIGLVAVSPVWTRG
jgi:glucose uptake protein